MISPCSANAPASQSGIGSRRGGSMPGRVERQFDQLVQNGHLNEI